MSFCIQAICFVHVQALLCCHGLQQELLFNSIFGNIKSYVSYEIDCYCYVNNFNTFEH